MSKECEICGRPIKTGSKYCWEHRHTAQSESLRIKSEEDKLIKRANQEYINWYVYRKIKEMPKWKQILSSKKVLNKKFEEEAIDNIVKRSEDYVKGIKEIIQTLKKEKEEDIAFKKSILS
jgi:hypothetical protein